MTNWERSCQFFYSKAERKADMIRFTGIVIGLFACMYFWYYTIQFLFSLPDSM